MSQHQQSLLDQRYAEWLVGYDFDGRLLANGRQVAALEASNEFSAAMLLYSSNIALLSPSSSLRNGSNKLDLLELIGIVQRGRWQNGSAAHLCQHSPRRHNLKQPAETPQVHVDDEDDCYDEACCGL